MALLTLASALPGCVGVAEPTWVRMQSPDSAERIAAIRAATRTRDAAVLPHLVDRLEDEDPAVRFAAILALEKLTGKRLGYAYGAAGKGRAAAIRSWRTFVANQTSGLHKAEDETD